MLVLLDLRGTDLGRLSDWPNNAGRSPMVADHGWDDTQHGWNLKLEE